MNDVTAVVDVDGNDVTFTWHAGDRVAISSAVPDAWAWEPRTTALEYVDVTYSHGSDTVPDAIVAIVCQIAGRALGQPADSTGIQQESIDDYSYTIGPAAASGAFGLLGDERAALDRYVRVGATARVGL